ncbi:aminotransferase class V-fold PLP-dependent enzyme [Tamlana sp. 2201CG12-4]|uniref:aminotransferase class V-fold PLP-dependent enzyme n=1 Tax=Tamlana sp. 2201CG12-4 TaxID=3112582 RepID=UPI002DB7E832|nr:aminotransferase class V-fold PLP-dependent enzyme [Tamlana sp. 2201CG12-4]MEC3908570.1 aminotransferase class V-fold PLP-dependent enzyme [Tamlana sp. 2201CG12-4]
MKNQKHLFDIPENVVYLNAANMSPLLKTTNTVGKAGIDQKSKPFTIRSTDFFEPLAELKTLYAQLIDTDEPQRIVGIPSVSYGIATVTNNITLQAGDEILVIEDQFPSNIYSWKRLAAKYNASIKIIQKPKEDMNCGKAWNNHILDSISEKTAVITMGNIHWAEGTVFNLKAISTKAKKHSALLIIDGSQSIGALPFSIKEIEPDALICAGYKWLLGAYSFGLAYYSPYFDNGQPIEENWSNRLNSENFAGLTDYEDNYKSFSNRFNMGESANFIAIPMLKDSITHILDWSPNNIQDYCHSISKHIIEPLRKLGCIIEEDSYRAKHLFGIKLPDSIDLDKLKTEFDKNKVYIANRGNYIRVSSHLFNTSKDFDILLRSVAAALN